MRISGCILLFMSILGCAQIEILDEPVTRITDAPNRIEGEEFLTLEKRFGLFGVYEAPDYYGGLTPRFEMVQALNRTDTEECLYFLGGRLGLCENVVVKVDGEYKHLKSKEDFQKCFAPIETEEEALSYISIWTGTTPMYAFEIKSRYRTFVEELNQSFAERVDSGFVAVTYGYENFGCGPHSHLAVKSFVDFNGNVTEIERIKVYQDPEEDDLCID